MPQLIGPFIANVSLRAAAIFASVLSLRLLASLPGYQAADTTVVTKDGAKKTPEGNMD